MQKSGKLELTWVGKYEEKEIEPRILVENPGLSYGDQDTGNMLIHGDNLIALKALEQDYVGQVKCIYIDPPYNTGSAFEHYDDGVEHSIWLNLMYQRLGIMKNLLSSDGTIWITLDDNEVHYLKIVCDELWGRKNFIADIIWNSRKSVSNDAIVSLSTNHILVYATDAEIIRKKAKHGELFRDKLDESKFSNPDNDPRGPWVADPFDAPAVRPNLTYEIINPNTGVAYLPPKGRHWRTEREKYEALLADGRIVFGKKGDSKPQQKRFLSECSGKGSVQTTLWEDVDTTTNATKHSQQLFDEPFTNPKPENLIERVLQLATNNGDLVLDSFLGSGTTAAVAHKMRRKWIGIEMGEQAYTFCKVRLDKVIKGRDNGGITGSQNWQGGGGYKFYELAPSLLVPNPKIPSVMQINPEYTFEQLCEAICKIEGFKYKPENNMHGRSSEKRFIHIAKDFVNGEYVNSILSTLADDESVLIYGTKIQSGLRLPSNVQVKKIPKDLLDKCTFESEVR